MATPSTWVDIEAAVFALATDIRRTEYLELLAQVSAHQSAPISSEIAVATAHFEWLCRFLSGLLNEALRTRRAVARSIDKRGKAHPARSALWTWEWKVRGTIDGFEVWRSAEKIDERWQIAFSLPQAETLPDGAWLSLAEAALVCGHHGALHYAEGYRRFLNQRLSLKASSEQISLEGSAEGLAEWLWDALRDGDLTARFINQELKPSIIPQDRWRTPLSIRYVGSDFIVLNDKREFDSAVQIALQPASLIEDPSAFDDAASPPPPAAIESEATNLSPAPSASIAPQDPRSKAGAPRDNEKRGRGAPEGPREGEVVRKIVARAQELY